MILFYNVVYMYVYVTYVRIRLAAVGGRFDG